jgi:curli biogenesis system outer membrane secretion channel CsgG
MKILLMLITLVAAPALFAATAGANEHSGTWKMNPAKSKHSSGPGPKNLIETVELDENHYKVEANGTAADGKPVHIEFNAKFDGKDYLMIGVSWADVVSVKWVDAHTPQMIQKKDSQVTTIITCRVSKDGNTRTCTLKGKGEQDHKMNDVVVFDRQ